MFINISWGIKYKNLDLLMNTESFSKTKSQHLGIFIIIGIWIWIWMARFKGLELIGWCSHGKKSDLSIIFNTLFIMHIYLTSWQGRVKDVLAFRGNSGKTKVRLCYWPLEEPSVNDGRPNHSNTSVMQEWAKVYGRILYCLRKQSLPSL